MIHLTCTNCRATLEIDDAFAGGVCRCQHCGTIQTVPVQMKGNATSAAAAATAVSAPSQKEQKQKSLYQHERRAQAQQQTGSGTGLDALSEAVASSGLARRGLRKPGEAEVMAAGGLEYATPPQQKKSTSLWIVLGAVATGMLLMVGLWGYAFIGRPVVVAPPPSTPVMGGSSGMTVTTPSGGTTGGTDEAVAVSPGAYFCGIDLSTATSIVYVLDRGSASAELLDALKAATYASLETLGPRRKFAIVFWQAGSEPAVTFPQQGMIEASAGNIAEATKAVEDVVAQGRSDPATAIDNAAARSPSDVVFVTAKGDDLGEEVVAQIGKALGGKRVHAVAIGEEVGTTLKTIAKQQNGSYQSLSKRQLNEYAQGR